MLKKKMVWRQACLEQADLILLRWIKWRLKKGVLTDSDFDLIFEKLWQKMHTNKEKKCKQNIYT